MWNFESRSIVFVPKSKMSATFRACYNHEVWIYLTCIFKQSLFYFSKFAKNWVILHLHLAKINRKNVKHYTLFLMYWKYSIPECIRTLASCHYKTWGSYRKQKFKKNDICNKKNYSILKLPYSNETYSHITIEIY